MVTQVEHAREARSRVARLVPETIVALRACQIVDPALDRGMIGLAWATRNPERLARLVVLNTAAFGLPPGKKLPWQIALIRNTPLGPLLVPPCGVQAK